RRIGFADGDPLAGSADGTWDWESLVGTSYEPSLPPSPHQRRHGYCRTRKHCPRSLHKLIGDSSAVLLSPVSVCVCPWLCAARVSLEAVPPRRPCWLRGLGDESTPTLPFP